MVVYLWVTTSFIFKFLLNIILFNDICYANGTEEIINLREYQTRL